MKVLLVITGLGMGGAEQVVTNLADALNAQGHEVKLVYLRYKAVVLPQSSDIEVVYLALETYKDFFKAYRKLRLLIKRMQPNVVHSHMFHANLLSRLARITISFPRLISSSHNTNEGGKLRMLAYTLTDSLADISTNVSQEAVDAFISKGIVKPGRMISVVNGIDTNKFIFNSKLRKEKRKQLLIYDKKIILAVGRLEEQKDYPNLIKAIAILKDKRKDFKVLIVGDGKLKAQLKKLTLELEVDEYIDFLGIRYDVPQLMSASDIFVLSSSWEGFGLVVAESMACERVVVATDCGGVREVVGTEGFLVEPRSSTLLADKLDKTLNLTDEERHDIGLLARQRIIDNFSLESNVDAYLKLYNI